MWPSKNRDGWYYGPNAQEQRAERFRQKQAWLQSISKKKWGR